MEKDIEQRYKDFLSTVSHELRTPLTSIRGFADTLLMSFDNISDEQKLKFIQIIKEQSNRLIELVENILSVSTFKNEKNVSAVMKSVNPIIPLKSAISLLKSRYNNRNFTIHDNAKDYTIFADENKLQQIFINLLENACKYSPDDNNTDISLNLYNNEYVIRIKDNGIGIEEKNFKRIFEKFSRIDNPLTRKTEGSGIGLYITKSLIEQMEGKILPIKQEKGACFEIRFPFYDIQIHSQKKFQGDENCSKN